MAKNGTSMTPQSATGNDGKLPIYLFINCVIIVSVCATATRSTCHIMGHHPERPGCLDVWMFGCSLVWMCAKVQSGSHD